MVFFFLMTNFGLNYKFIFQVKQKKKLTLKNLKLPELLEDGQSDLVRYKEVM